MDVGLIGHADHWANQLELRELNAGHSVDLQTINVVGFTICDAKNASLRAGVKHLVRLDIEHCPGLAVVVGGQQAPVCGIRISFPGIGRGQRVLLDETPWFGGRNCLSRRLDINQSRKEQSKC